MAVVYNSWRSHKFGNAKKIVLTCLRIKYHSIHNKNLHSKKQILLIKEQPKTTSPSMPNSICIRGLADNSAVTLSAGEDTITYPVYPGQVVNLPIDSFANLTNIRFEHVSFSSSIQPLFTLPILQKLSFVMCEIGDALTNIITESPNNILPNLTDLEINCCYDLPELPSGLSNLSNLRNLSITNCHELDALPRNLGNLSSLEILNLHCCTKLQELPESIGSLCNLSFLDVSDCLSINQLPEQIGGLFNLRVLKMTGAHGLQELPESMRELSQLEEVICDEETSCLWMDLESDLYNLQINVVEDDRFESFLKIVQ